MIDGISTFIAMQNSDLFYYMLSVGAGNWFGERTPVMSRTYLMRKYGLHLLVHTSNISERELSSSEQGDIYYIASRTKTSICYESSGRFKARCLTDGIWTVYQRWLKHKGGIFLLVPFTNKKRKHS